MISLIINISNSFFEALQCINLYLVDFFSNSFLIVSNFFSTSVQNIGIITTLICFTLLFSVFVFLSTRKILKNLKDLSIIGSGVGTGYMAYQSGSNGRNNRRREEEENKRRQAEAEAEARKAQEEARRAAIREELQRNKIKELEEQLKALQNNTKK